jgi:hypothetical protein
MIHIDICDEPSKIKVLCGNRISKKDSYTYIAIEDIGKKDPFRATCPNCLAISNEVARGSTLEYAKAQAQP